MALDLNDPEVKKAIDDAVKTVVAERVAAETAGLKRSRDAVLAEKKALEDKLKDLPGDLDIDEYTRLKTEAEKQRQERELAAGNFEKLRAELIAKHEAAMKKAADEAQKVAAERDAAAKRYQSYYIESAATAAIAKADGIPELLMPRVLGHLKFVPGENGEADSVQVVGKDGQPRFKDGKGGVIGLDDFVSELKADDVWARGFKASGASGGGANGSGGASGGAGGKKVTRPVFDSYSPAQRAEFVKAGGQVTDPNP
jgi:hypothetical protein